MAVFVHRGDADVRSAYFDNTYKNANFSLLPPSQVIWIKP